MDFKEMCREAAVGALRSSGDAFGFGFVELLGSQLHR
jgi:hypothetical protein